MSRVHVRVKREGGFFAVILVLLLFTLSALALWGSLEMALASVKGLSPP